jgi:demethylmenaquinone methyltransferase/2-methoxy-6-polyprenyl-1,4-benzoquinol methylase
MRALPVIAKRISKNPAAYIYLAESIQAWPNQGALAQVMRQSGWESVSWQDLSFGIVAVHIGYKGQVA